MKNIMTFESFSSMFRITYTIKGYDDVIRAFYTQANSYEEAKELIKKEWKKEVGDKDYKLNIKGVTKVPDNIHSKIKLGQKLLPES